MCYSCTRTVAPSCDCSNNVNQQHAYRWWVPPRQTISASTLLIVWPQYFALARTILTYFPCFHFQNEAPNNKLEDRPKMSVFVKFYKNQAGCGVDCYITHSQTIVLINTQATSKSDNDFLQKSCRQTSDRPGQTKRYLQ